MEAAVAALDAAVEEPAVAPADVVAAAVVAAEVVTAEVEPAEGVAVEAPDWVATACVSACRRLERRSTPNEARPEAESPPEESADFPGEMCGGAVKPTWYLRPEIVLIDIMFSPRRFDCMLSARPRRSLAATRKFGTEAA